MTQSTEPRVRGLVHPVRSTERAKDVKCLVWDLDNTLWNGVLLEPGDVTLRAGAREVIEELDRRGILQSIASRNNHDDAMQRLSELGLAEFFLVPQINWNAKSHSLRQIADSLNIGLDTFAFIDDQPFELDEVHDACPEVLCLPAQELKALLDMPRLNPRFITDDSRRRRSMYQADALRSAEESTFQGPTEAFLASLGMVLTLREAQTDDLARAEELTIRTNQLNTTGYTYSYEELDALRRSPDHLLLIAGLDDKYGSYGKIGLALIEKKPDAWIIRLFLMSCRVMSRGVGSIFINHLRALAHEAGVPLQAEMVSTDRNRMMYMTYKFMGFSEISVDGPRTLFQSGAGPVPEAPPHVELVVD